MNVFVHDPAWGWWIIGYFFLGGLAAGCYFVATLVELFGHEEDRPIARLGYRLAFPLICVCAVFLIADLDRPERFLHMVLQSEVMDEALEQGWPRGGWGTMAQAVMLKWWSPMSLGAQAVGIFGLCSFLSFLASAWPGSWFGRLLSTRILGGFFKLLGSVVGFFIAAYTGALLTATNQPLWSVSDWISPLFLTSAASTGIALLLLLGRRIPHESRARLERADLWVLGLELFVFLIFLASLGGVLPLALQTLEGMLLVGVTLVIGLLVPLWLHLSVHPPTRAAATSTDETTPESRVSLAAVCALGSGFILRFSIVRIAPALLHRFPEVKPSDVEFPLWQTNAGKALLVVTLLLAALIPNLLMRKWRLSSGQTALAGAVSILVLAGVANYSASPSPGTPVIGPDIRVRISPEEGRERGGGPGASNINRPKKFFFHSQVEQATQ
ncbi:MAG: polysulfide reductase NrfD [Planctomycetes bacterium]|nr:polysulfide reductase NrfD [Planctomycetota bacterium]